MMQRSHTLFALLLTSVLLQVPWIAASQAQDLFAARDDFSIILEFPLRELVRNKAAKKPLPATLHYRDSEGHTISIPLEVRARGNKRLELCSFPPILLDLKPKRSTGTLFAGFKELKLVTQCKRGDRYADYVRLEQQIYQVFNLLTPLSFRTRMLNVTYRDSTGEVESFTEPGFVIEEIEDVARRNTMQRVRKPRLSIEELDSTHASLSTLFQYLVGNTDWSAYVPSEGDDECCHNGRPIASSKSGPVVVVPYDFDHTGLIDADYATPPPNLRIRSVTQRVYRGFCAHNDGIPAAVARFREVRGPLESIFRQGEVSERRRENGL
ncbi:MAG: hypothetical protein H6978_13860, partial [Gammaproteobacteria bacterium]|nr:hypothetical protein [Gammaproteobacteria bacterium]